MFCVKIPRKPDTTLLSISPISRYQHLCLDSQFASIWSIFSVVRMLKLMAGSYLIVITEHDCVGTYWGHPIYKVSSLKVFPCDHSLSKSLAEQKKAGSEFSQLLNVAEQTCGLYLS
ncbi:hypothetical protein LWI29_004710 [Acer saccharum]|uniref:SAC domain-containing protein n=1 Tax=Acer saccharum TaxID=4024 RepID=A0AA39TAS1_ACESA|nr:hypothetical protein LWI29_004710 [Acer saccharum]